MDFFVERAMTRILDEHESDPSETIGLGSSMGATAALRFALQRDWRGAVAVCPHIDLDLCAEFQGRQRHVAAIVGRTDVDAPELTPVTREIRQLAETVDPTARIVVQSAEDDDGVHHEQVLPFVDPVAPSWRRDSARRASNRRTHEHVRDA